jgi:N-acetylmuramoyl-L-alanine amidase
MKINIHAGHNPDGKIACGAVGLIKESTENRKVASEVIRLLRVLGHTVYDCTVDNGFSVSDVLNKIVAKCNAHKVDYDISIHFNSGAKDTKGNGKTTGVEVLLYNFKYDDLTKIANNICNEVAKLGYRNRGLKRRPDLYFLRKTVAKAMLIECCFVDDKDDVALYDYKTMARAIVKGITGQEVKEAQPVNSFLVRVIVPELNIRAGAGTEYNKTSSIKDKGTYTIVGTAKSKDGGTWGKLKSGAGWINISSDYVSRV